MLDLLIEGGLVVDGTGNPGFPGAVGVEGETLRVFRGDVSEVQAARRLDAVGQVVCPGFVDFHAHSGLVMLAEPRHEPKVRQGITTEVIGVDGNSYAPFRDQTDFDRLVMLNSGLDGDPVLPGRWSTVAEYLAMFDQKVAVNVCYLVGNSPLRIDAVGWNERAATADEQADMRALLREAMEEGAWGMSTGLDYPPGRYADTDELVDLCREAARLGGIYHTHVRYWLGDRYLDPFKEAIEIGRRSEVGLHVTHLFQRTPSPTFPRSPNQGAKRILALVEDARSEGVDVSFDIFPSIYGGTRLLIMVPGWAQEGGPDRLLEVLRSKEGRERIRQEIVPRGPGWQETWLSHFKRPENAQYEGKSAAEVGLMRGQDVADALLDLLIEEDLRVSYFASTVNTLTLSCFVLHPLSVVGTDALLLGELPTPQSYGAYPTILGEYVRDEGMISLPEAIRKMTSHAAGRLGIPDRGLLRDGYRADVVVFDPSTVQATATRARPKQFPIGINHVLVNGQFVVENGDHTGRLPGRALRRGRAST